MCPLNKTTWLIWFNDAGEFRAVAVVVVESRTVPTGTYGFKGDIFCFFSG